jgi:hypothetical protein
LVHDTPAFLSAAASATVVGLVFAVADGVVDGDADSVAGVDEAAADNADADGDGDEDGAGEAGDGWQPRAIVSTRATI